MTLTSTERRELELAAHRLGVAPHDLVRGAVLVVARSILAGSS